MTIRRILCAADPDFDRVFGIYEGAFDRLERRDIAEQTKLLQRDDYHMCAAEEGGAMLGGIFFWETEDFIYLEHLFTEERTRGKGYGAMLLDYIKERGKTVIGEIEFPVSPLQARRQKFYERNGFVTNPAIAHIQPKMHIGDEDLPLLIISSPAAVDGKLYGKFHDFLKRQVEVKEEGF